MDKNHAWDPRKFMIIGLGNDIVSTVRIEKIIEKFGSRFESRVFSESERALAWKRGSPCIRTYSSRWASKEAFVKALGTGISTGISWKDIVVKNLPSGKPVLFVSGVAANYLDEIIPNGLEAVVHLTISDDIPWVNAVVIIEARRSLPKQFKFSK